MHASMASERMPEAREEPCKQRHKQKGDIWRTKHKTPINRSEIGHCKRDRAVAPRGKALALENGRGIPAT